MVLYLKITELDFILKKNDPTLNKDINIIEFNIIWVFIQWFIYLLEIF